jgi:hypothetical protein
MAVFCQMLDPPVSWEDALLSLNVQGLVMSRKRARYEDVLSIVRLFGFGKKKSVTSGIYEFTAL